MTSAAEPKLNAGQTAVEDGSTDSPKQFPQYLETSEAQ
jgi:hypothetical protein